MICEMEMGSNTVNFFWGGGGTVVLVIVCVPKDQMILPSK
jgi:hypothetical protein